MSGLHDLRRHIHTALASANVGPAVLGLDISFNEHADEAFRPHWLLHYRAHVPAKLSKAQRRELRACFPKSDLIRRPLRIERSDDNPRAIAYTMKPNFGRRQSYEDERKRPNRAGKCRNTRGRPLRGIERVELALFLDQIGLRRRLMLHEASLVIEEDGSLIIEANPPASASRAAGTRRSGSQGRTPSV